MANILISSTNSMLSDLCKTALQPEHQVFLIDQHQLVATFIAQQAINLLVIDGGLLQSDAELAAFKKLGCKILLLGKTWPEDRQISLLVSGISGYCDVNTVTSTLLKAANSILLGDIWVQRHLVPRIIEQLIQLNNTIQPATATTTPTAYLQSLTHRELDVAKMIRQGENNKIIASALNISERTVKAHLTSIYTKFNVQNRLHLALLLKELHL